MNDYKDTGVFYWSWYIPLIPLFQGGGVHLNHATNCVWASKTEVCTLDGFDGMGRASFLGVSLLITTTEAIPGMPLQESLFSMR